MCKCISENRGDEKNRVSSIEDARDWWTVVQTVDVAVLERVSAVTCNAESCHFIKERRALNKCMNYDQYNRNREL